MRNPRNLESLARMLVLTLALALPAGLLVERVAGGSSGAIEVHARMPESGGWSPASITIPAGEPLRLRLVSDDVLHGFAVGQQDDPAIDLEPGKVREVTLTFDRPGKYTFYCTRWCGANHWRMRGTIEVTGDAAPLPAASPPPYLELGLDLDRPHPAEDVPSGRPSAALGSVLAGELPARYTSRAFIRTHSPAEIFDTLGGDPITAGLTDDQVWNLVAYLWSQGTSPEKLAEGKALYDQNCAACHGENGAGDGVMAGQLAEDNAPDSPGGLRPMDGHTTVGPANLTDPETILGASPAVLHGKILRGGMGTGMPYWGPIFTDEEIWSIVDYLWSFQFE